MKKRSKPKSTAAAYKRGFLAGLLAAGKIVEETSEAPPTFRNSIALHRLKALYRTTLDPQGPRRMTDKELAAEAAFWDSTKGEKNVPGVMGLVDAPERVPGRKLS